MIDNEEYLAQQVDAYYKTLTRNYMYHFKKFKPELYDFIFEYTKFLDVQNPTFRGRLTCVLKRQKELVICQYPGCDEVLDISDCRPYMEFPKHCCCAHAAKDIKTQELKEQSLLDHFGVRNPGQLESTKEAGRKAIAEHKDEIVVKRKKTVKDRYGSENYMSFGTPEFKARVKELHGDENYRNIEKAKETFKNRTEEQKQDTLNKRRNTRKQKLEEDPDYQNKITEKSISTRKANNGEDYTGRKKCKQTMLDKYGVENAYQLQSVKDKIKADNLKEYGVEYYSSTQECRDKVAATNLERYNATTYLASDQFKEKQKAHNLEEYGVEYTFQRQDVKDKIQQTNIERYGFKYAMQNNEVSRKTRQKYLYNGIHFDSGLELAYYIWLTDRGLKFKYNSSYGIPYVFNGKTHVYMRDFEIFNDDGTTTSIELKGAHFFDDNGKMICPYRNADWTDKQYSEICALYEAKHQCMLDNDIVILRDDSDEIKQCYNYIDCTYGKDYISQFKCDKIASSKS